MSASPRIAFLSPFNPQRSGISDYSEELLPYMGAHAQVDLVVPPYRIANQSIRERFPVLSIDEFEKDVRRYDGILYQIGNNFHHHSYIVPLMRRYPGVCVLHDYCLQYLMLGLTVGQGHFPALAEALKRSGYRSPVRDALRLWWNVVDPDVFTLAPALLGMSRAAIVHSEYAAGLVRRDAPELPVRVIHMAVPKELPAAPVDLLRQRYGLSERDFVCASISTASRSKRLPLALRAVSRAIHAIPNLKFVIVGGGNIGDESRRLVKQLGLERVVTFTGWLSAEDYRGMIQLANVAMDLRYPSGAETSASLMRALAAGRALIVSRQGTFAELPDGCCFKIPVELPGEEQKIADALVTLATDPQRLAQMEQASREFAGRTLSLEKAGRDCVEFAVSAGRAAPPAAFQPWPEHETPPRSAWAVRLIYRATRSAYLLRRYGPRDTLRRIRGEWAARGQAGSPGL